MKKFISLYFTIVSFLFAQNESSLSGFIYDKTTGEALIGANVFIPNINRGAVSNVFGFYSIPKIKSGIYNVNISYVGYKTYTIKLDLRNDEDKRLNVYLEQDVIQGKEIIVKADSIRVVERLFNKPVSNIELSPKQIQSVPRVIEADLLRTLQTLPGIVPLSDFSSAIYVRGGTPDQNLFMIDGTDVYNPEHAFGLFSTFNTDAIKKVEVYKGGFGAEYGGRLSSVIDVTNNDGNRNFYEGKASLSLLSLSSTISGPIRNIGSISGSIRRTYLDQTIAKWVDEVPDYYFIDGNLKAFFDLNNSNKLSVSYFGSKDNLNFVLDKKRPESLGFDYIWGNQTGSINLRSIFASNLFGNFWITFSHFNSFFDFDDVGVKEDNQINDLTFKGNIQYFYSENFNFKFGFEQKNANGGLKQDFPGGKVDASKSRKLFSFYSSSVWKPNPLWNIEFGLRGDYFFSDKIYKNLDPRFSLKYRLSENANIKLSAGSFHQYANRIPRLFFVSIWTTADSFVRGSSSNHFIFGYERALGEKFQLEFETYYKTYKDIYSYNQNYVADVVPSNYSNDNVPIYNNQKGLFTRGDGYSYGIEFLLRKETGAITGWLSYSFSNTYYTFDGINQGKSFMPRHNRTHAINLVSTIDLNNFINEIKNQSFEKRDKQWILGLNFTFFSGQPITLPSSVYLFTQFPDWEQNKNSLATYPSTINTFNLPYYSRFDFSLTYEIDYDSWKISPYIQVFNLFNRKNVWFIQYKNEIKDGRVKQKIENVNMFPILPSFGITIKF
ncbi:TonB-dependent receptor [Stygiobacter electus]|uniref:TonB-dependent receptor n=1 Tax=Stygiobacter electus TaxID=3032292 RepID=A0AAE3NY03_9BACT|nr:TonB-dependent receptor [Stygiobacter electus]MDF1613001.1 TonB-dependent receptor [Stygiobacter electus]